MLHRGSKVVDTEEIKSIEEDIKKSGFPLEIEVSSVLRKDGWDLRNQAYYMDEDEGKPRAVDIVASKSYFEDFLGHNRLRILLIIECKKSQKPWVFFTTPEDRKFSAIPILTIKHCANPKLENQRFYKWIMKSLHYALPYGKKRAIVHYEPFKAGEGREIFEAALQVTKALNFELKQDMETSPKIPITSIGIFFPVIVFDGHLYECQLQNGDTKVLSTDYVQYLREQRELFIIDVFTKQFLLQYLGIIDKEVEALKASLKR
jgi:hypothetical protein